MLQNLIFVIAFIIFNLGVFVLPVIQFVNLNCSCLRDLNLVNQIVSVSLYLLGDHLILALLLLNQTRLVKDSVHIGARRCA